MKTAAPIMATSSTAPPAPMAIHFLPDSVWPSLLAPAPNREPSTSPVRIDAASEGSADPSETSSLPREADEPVAAFVASGATALSADFLAGAAPTFEIVGFEPPAVVDAGG